jgi:hypothetical protein
MRKADKPSLNVENEDSDSFEETPYSSDSDEQDESNQFIAEEELAKEPDISVILGYIGEKLHSEDDEDKYATKIGGQPVSEQPDILRTNVPGLDVTGT